MNHLRLNLLNIDEMAKKLCVKKSWLYDRTRTGQIPCYKLGKYVRFDEAEILEWVRHNSTSNEE